MMYYWSRVYKSPHEHAIYFTFMEVFSIHKAEIKTGNQVSLLNGPMWGQGNSQDPVLLYHRDIAEDSVTPFQLPFL